MEISQEEIEVSVTAKESTLETSTSDDEVNIAFLKINMCINNFHRHVQSVWMLISMKTTPSCFVTNAMYLCTNPAMAS